MANSSNQRLAKNTFLLYSRTIIVMFVTLYVSRIVLNALGETDYGVYNAVGGIVGMMSILSNSLVAATQRFISFELGKQDGRPAYIFSLSIGLHLFIGLVILIVAELIGVWFLNTHMNIPEERMVAANWVLQFSLVAFIIHLITIPYNAVIIAYEEMGVYALISIVEVILKLLFALTLCYFTDTLSYYSLTLALISLVILIINYLFCKLKHASYCKIHIIYNRNEYRNLGAFIGWNFIGSSAGVLSKQGVNILLNIFFGVIVNAGRGIAMQVDNAVNQFVNSFTTAIRPQITKTFAAKEYNECFRLVNKGSKMIIFLTMLFVIPLLFRTDYILKLWLKSVPQYAVLFTQLSFMILILDALSIPLYFLILATGRIRNYQLSAGTLGFVTFPLTWLCLYLGMQPEVCYYILFAVDLVRWFIQLYFLYKLTSFSVIKYFAQSIYPISLVALSVSILSYPINTLLPNSILGLVEFCFATSLILGISIFVFGLTNTERQTIIHFIKHRLFK